MPVPYFGHWSIDERASGLVRDDGKTLRFLGFAENCKDLAIANRFDRQWMRFEINPGDGPYLLLVQRRDVAPDSGGRRNLIWRLDHIRSTRLNGIELLDFESWCRLDRLARDAFVCWPQMAPTGIRPSIIAIDGGWHMGRWTADLYRTYDSVTLPVPLDDRRPVVDDPMVPPHSSDIVEAPRTWRFRAAATTLPAAREAELLRALTQAPPRDLPTLLEELRPARPHLASADRLFMPFAIGKSSTSSISWIYLDDTLITARFGTSHTPASLFPRSWTFSLSKRGIIGSIDRAKDIFIDLDLAGSVDTFRSGKFLRCREIMEEAIWQWQDSSVDIPSLDGKTHRVVISAPDVAGAQGWIHAGGSKIRTVGMSVARSLAGRDCRPLAHAVAFTDDSAEVPADAPRLGRLDFSPSKSRMTNRVTGQTLAFETTLVGSADATKSQIAIFRYRDSTSDFSIRVYRPVRRSSHEGEGWIADYTAFSSLSERFQDSAYGRGVQAFILDALLFWPDSETFGSAPSNVVAEGGWLNGRWEPLMRRSQKSYLLPRADRLTSSVPPEQRPCRRWLYHPSPDQRRRHQEIRIDPPAAVSVQPLDLRAFAERQLTDRCYWLRDDGKALLYICAHHDMRRGSDGDLVSEPLFEYCDEDVRLRLHLSHTGALSLASLYWPRAVKSERHFSDEDVLPPQLFATSPGRFVSWYPQEALWLRLVDAADARLIGGGIGRDAAAATQGAYIAGIFDSGAETWTWLGPTLIVSD